MQKSTISFLRNLKKNNNKPWFDAHRKDYEAARSDFASFIQEVIDKHAKKDSSIANISAKETMFRINRDIRFSKDKSPYKTNFGASINKGGRKAFSTAGYYFHLEPDNKSFAGGGLYMPMPSDLAKVRQEIDYNFKEFRKILAAKPFKTIYKDLDRSAEFSLTRVPKGFEPGNPAADYLRLKSLIAFVNFRDEELVKPSVVPKTQAAFQALQPLLKFLNEALL